MVSGGVSTFDDRVSATGAGSVRFLGVPGKPKKIALYVKNSNTHVLKDFMCIANMLHD